MLTNLAVLYFTVLRGLVKFTRRLISCGKWKEELVPEVDEVVWSIPDVSHVVWDVEEQEMIDEIRQEWQYHYADQLALEAEEPSGICPCGHHTDEHYLHEGYCQSRYCGCPHFGVTVESWKDDLWEEDLGEDEPKMILFGDDQNGMVGYG